MLILLEMLMLGITLANGICALRYYESIHENRRIKKKLKEMTTICRYISQVIENSSEDDIVKDALKIELDVLEGVANGK